MAFDNSKQGGEIFPLKNFGGNRKIPGVSGALNTPPSDTPQVPNITTYVPSGMAPETDPPPSDSMGMLYEQKMDGIIDSGDNSLKPFKHPFNMNPGGNAGGGGGISDEKQGGEHPFGKPF